MAECILRVKDQVNIKFEGLDPMTRKKLVQKLSFMNPKARHMPAFKLGRWDGKVPFATIGGGTYYNLLADAANVVLDAGYKITDIIDERPDWNLDLPLIDKTYLSDITWPEGHPKQGEPIILNDHQVEAVNNYLTPNEYGNRHSMQSISTSAGKTIITACLSKSAQKYGRTLVIVPGKDLVTQTLEDYANVGLDTGIYFSDFKMTDNHHIISTWQSLTRMLKDESENFYKITKDVVAIIVDEAHTITGKELRDMLCGPLAHVPLRWALTGTIPKEPHEFNALLCAVGPKTGEVRADALQELGILSRCDIDIMQLVDDVNYRSWDQEIEYLTTDKIRVKWIAEEIKRINLTGNTLVLVSRVPMGKELAALLDTPFIYGNVASKKRKEEYKSINTEDNKIIVATFGVASTGINIPRIFNLVLIEPGKSFVRVIQSIGRGLRRAADKDFVQVYDICSTAKFSKRHLTVRKGDYAEAGYPHKVRKVTYR